MADAALYRAAYAFYGTKLWKELQDTELFALRYTDGQTGYCCMMGMAGSHIALAVYVGEEALESFYQVAAGVMSSGDDGAFALLMTQDCLMCSFEKKGELEPDDLKEIEKSGLHFKSSALPLFRQYKPGYVPWFMNDSFDRQRLTAALMAAVEVAGRLPRKEKQLSLLDTHKLPIVETREELGFSQEIFPGKTLPLLIPTEDGFAWDMMVLPEGRQADYPAPVPKDELRVARLKQKKQKKGLTLECGILSVPLPVADERGSGYAPYFSMMLMAMDSGDKMEPLRPCTFKPGSGEEDALECFIDYMEKHGVPEQILVQDLRAMDLLRHLAQSMGIQLVYMDELPCLGKMTSMLMKSLLGGMGDSDIADTQLWEEEEEEDNAVRDDPKKPEHIEWNYGIKTEGVCENCGKTVPKSAMLKHIKSCMVKPEVGDGQRCFLMSVQGMQDPNYFLYLSVRADAPLKDLDEYLRNIWLDCCGHLSMFSIVKLNYFSSDPELGQSMRVRFSSVLEKGMTFGHEYDFGSTTGLKLKVLDDFTAHKQSRSVILAARNQSPRYKCVVCGMPAVWVDQNDWHAVPGRSYCDACIKLLEDPELILPVVNSPRCGVCGYEG